MGWRLEALEERLEPDTPYWLLSWVMRLLWRASSLLPSPPQGVGRQGSREERRDRCRGSPS